ncbi:putative morphogenetic function [Sinorhizobium sojae CCBAU 05684]|uniref:Putative morphogenetic function n=1 Tax=Sinorhizobium sojae CCBAU 05684 TaxID=716928 RepID=A0A249PA16_9HYPH|nr:putative morphogenetic function [Sinorhizobium sojae CCBAU 05684]
MRLEAGVSAHLGIPHRFVCLTDMHVLCDMVPLEEGWPGWWSKMELFRADIAGDLLYFDLDTIITGDLSDMASIGRLAIMRDVYRPDGLQSSVMFIPEAVRKQVWEVFTEDPAHYMAQYSCGGDQAFLELLWLGKAAIWQDVLPGQVQSYKAAHMAERGVPDNCRAVIFHGRPKPRDIGWKL